MSENGVGFLKSGSPCSGSVQKESVFVHCGIVKMTEVFFSSRSAEPHYYENRRESAREKER